jgi:hypothetical protein
MNPIWLSINIPTFNRPDHLKSLCNRLADCIRNLRLEDRKTIRIQIFDNCSSLYPPLETLLKEFLGLGCEFVFKRHPENYGGDENISLCGAASSDSKYTWVLGDDDLPSVWSVEHVLDLTRKIPDVGLVILTEDHTKWEEVLPVPAKFKNYKSLIEYFKPYPIHDRDKGVNPVLCHTLISANVFLSSIYRKDIYFFVRDIMNPALGLPANFCHMYAIVPELLNQGHLSVVVSKDKALESTKLIAKDGVDGQEKFIRAIYATYMNYIRSRTDSKVGFV